MQAFWKTLATPYKDNEYVIFDTNNECTYPPTLQHSTILSLSLSLSLFLSLCFEPSLIIPSLFFLNPFIQSTTWTKP